MGAFCCAAVSLPFSFGWRNFGGISAIMRSLGGVWVLVAVLWGGGGGGIDRDLYRYLRLFVPDLRFEFETLYVRYRFSRS